MSIDELSQELRALWDEAPERGKTPMVHLFGIKYAHELRGKTLDDLKDLCERAGRPQSMGTEVSKGRALAPYVDVKPKYR